MIDTIAKLINEQGTLNEAETKASLDNSLKTLQLQSVKNDIILRKDFAYKFFWLTVCYLIGVLILLVQSGITKCYGVTFLSDSVLITILTTTTVNILALLYAVAHYLFPVKTNTAA